MENSRLIHDYLDGELSNSEQGVLFTQLAQDDELRQEFYKEVRFHTTAQSDLAHVAPPVSATNAIFTQLGFSIPTTDYTLANIQTSEITASGIFSKFWKNNKLSLSLLILLLFFFPIGILLFNNHSMDQATNNLNRTIQLENKTEPILQNSIPFDLSLSNDLIGNTENATSNGAPVNDNISINLIPSNDNISEKMGRSVDLGSNNVSKEDAMSGLDIYSINRIVTFANSEDYNKSRSYSGLNQRKNVNYPLSLEYYNSTSGNKSWFINARMTSFEAINNPIINGSTNSLLNWAFSFNHNYSNDLAVGIEFGKESYPLEYQTDRDGTQFQTTRNPQLYWIGASLRYYALDFSNEYATPFAQPTLGVNSLGPLSRMLVGLRISPFRNSSNFSLEIGAEGLMNFYFVQKNLYVANNLGLTAGINYNF